jgi:hypothetical protein
MLATAPALDLKFCLVSKNQCPLWALLPMPRTLSSQSTYISPVTPSQDLEKSGFWLICLCLFHLGLILELETRKMTAWLLGVGYVKGVVGDGLMNPAVSVLSALGPSSLSHNCWLMPFPASSGECDPFQMHSLRALDVTPSWKCQGLCKQSQERGSQPALENAVLSTCHPLSLNWLHVEDLAPVH